ncbi:hypothetical protein [Levilactobacillus acidifarinae]|uniref:XkdX family protein n=1 Tax=Levilactobacillus acidifarinae DSM 19394 = JCM 15949 TaxID=1423715 RepID=A0A0R1LL72_9LACO|nr:hypothetical protein [Levilactobacillus acidifarinae]KRK94259.1 hypothetical protein FD25_GL000213 [Levilactobacillus acidifarinae DSM 19394]GEO70551.1 hypothetical protein LAC03_24610 [Levilactobacillus acidifarinae]
MVQIYTWAYQVWKTITLEKLRGQVGKIDGITEADFKSITGEDYESATTDVNEAKISSANTESMA